MRKFKVVNKAECKRLRVELDAVLQAFGKKAGLKVVSKNMSYDPTLGLINVKVEALLADAKAPEVVALEQYADIDGVDYTTSFDHATLGLIRLVGFNVRAHKRPYLVETTGGRRYTFPTSAVQRMFKAPEVK